MMKNSEIVTQWVIDTVKSRYADDIALVVAHTTLRLDDDSSAVSYFVPITERGRAFARTFILEGEGFDIWGIDYERLERFARLEEYNVTCLADGEVLYARTPEDTRRFEALKKRQAALLADGAKSRECALEAYAEARSIFLETILGEGGDVRLGAGYVLDYLARAVAFTNHRYFKRAQTDQLGELAAMADVPDGFAGLYLDTIMARDDETRKRLCCALMRATRDFLAAHGAARADAPRPEANFQDLADWYAELSYTWLRIRRYCEANDAVKAYMWGILLQEELNHVCADFGLAKMELLTAFDARDLAAFAARADSLEAEMRAAIRAGGGTVREYADAGELAYEV